MTNLNDKERAEERKYALDQEKEFKIVARRNKLLGMWAAELMQYDDEKAKSYAKAVVLSDFEEPGEDDVFRKVQGDLKSANLTVADADIRQKMSELLAVAHEQLDKEG